MNLEKKDILVTGGAGFLGSYLCEVLLEKGAKVSCLDNLCSGRTSNIEHLFDNDNFIPYLEWDIVEDVIIRPHGGFDVVYHLASRASPLEFGKYPMDIMRVNTIGTENALQNVCKHGRFIYSSTSETYGNANIFPTPESYRGNVNTLGIRACYDEGKRAGEAICMSYFRQWGVGVRIARIFNTYGPRMRADGHYGRVVPRFVCQTLENKPITVFGDGTQTRSFCYVTDTIDALVRLATTDGIAGNVFNIGNPLEVPIRELAILIRNMNESASEITYSKIPEDDPIRRCPDISKAMDILAWEPKVGLVTGLTRTIEAMRKEICSENK